MIVYDSPMDILFASPIAIVLALLTVLSLCYPLIAKVFRRRKAVK